MATYAVPKRYAQPAEPEPLCPNQDDHTPAPSDYLGWWAWAERMNRTHGQRRCEGCGRWAIWYPRADGEFAPCWDCGQAKVDPAAFGDEELLCAGCVADREAKAVADAKARLRYRWAETT